MQKSERPRTRYNLDDAFPPTLESLLGNVIGILEEILAALRARQAGAATGSDDVAA